jgi:hypothetical protein
MSNRTTRLALAAAAVVAVGALLIGPASLFAQNHAMPGGGMHGGKQGGTHGGGTHGGGTHGGGTHGTPNAQASPSTKAFIAANERMHQGMMIEFTGDADMDFVKGMIPHHQGAIDMAKIVLEHGKDPQTRKLAEEIVKAQAAEIAMMTAWLKAKGAK